jgi:hypothetical protein
LELNLRIVDLPSTSSILFTLCQIHIIKQL